MKLRWECGEEAICPKCHHHNACLGDYRRAGEMVYICRDCKSVFKKIGEEIKVGETDLGSYGIRPTIEAECIEVK